MSSQSYLSPDGRPTAVVRHNGSVHRRPGPETPAVLSLLRHLEAAGFPASPRVVGNGYDEEGNQVLTFIEGELVHPRAWSDEAIGRVGQLLRALHDATASFRRPPDAVWRSWFLRSSEPTAIIGFGEAAPWNIVARDGLPVAFIGWENAGPIERLDELSGAAWLNAQLHDDDVAEMFGLPDASVRANQLRRFLDAYGLPALDRAGFVTRMVEYAIRDCAREAIAPPTAGPEDGPPITPSSTDPLPLWALAWRARSAAWLLRHRPMLEGAIGV